VRRVVSRVVEQLGPEITSRGIDLKVDEPLGEILASPTHIYQLFLNLISNAVKYNNNRNPVVTVSRLQSPAEDAHRYLVSDNGPGIDPENIDLMFQPFFKGESGGTGLGLATVMKVVKLYAGTVAVYNDGGACFEFTLYDARRDVENG
jgi:signal transduction histidine kinase